MFFRLRLINGIPLPAPIVIAGRSYACTSAGLLLEPPNQSSWSGTYGYAVLKFMGTPSPDDSGMIAASSEPYRWLRPTALEIAPVLGTRGQTFQGELDGLELTLGSGPDVGFLPPDTALRFAAAPEMPIPLDWQDMLYFGPPHIRRLDNSDPLPPEAEAMLEATKLELVAEARTQARERLVAAWRAPA